MRHSIGRSLFRSIVGSSRGDSVASKTAYSLPTVTETDASNVVAVDGSLQESCSSKPAHARLAAGHATGENPVSDSLKTLQEIKCSEKRNSRKCGNGREKVGRNHCCQVVVIKELCIH